MSLEENKIRFEQEISIIWGISSHPNTLIFVGYSENPPSIITKVSFFSFLFFSLFLRKKKEKKNFCSYMMKICIIILKMPMKIFQVKLF